MGSTLPETSRSAAPKVITDGEFDGMLGLFRAQNGRDQLPQDRLLIAAAQGHAQDMAASGFFAHESSDGSSLRDRLKRVGYDACFGAENIGEGYPDQRTVFQGWQGSDGHRRNMLLREAKAYGLGRAGPYWVLVMAAEC
ncbi:MAG: CAP domain-containing protein [Pseudomonadota bacterium]